MQYDKPRAEELFPSESPSEGGMSDLEGARNFCGRSLNEAKETCSRDLHCPSGLNGEW